MYRQVVVRREYDFRTNREPRFIIDTGAHIGLASVLFANRFPSARIVAVEPERNNYELLLANTAPYTNITTVNAALWSENREIDLFDTGHGGWAYTTYEGAPNDPNNDEIFAQTATGLTIDTLMRRFQLEQVDLLKVDIEGSEREVFQDASAWIDRVDSIVVELHEFTRIGCNQSFYTATKSFSKKWQIGENVVVSREDGLLVSP